MTFLFALAHTLFRLVPGNVAFALIPISALGAGLIWQLAWRRPVASRRPGVMVALMVLAFGLADWILLAALPRLGLSFGPARAGLTWITIARMLVWMGLWAGLAIAGRLGSITSRKNSPTRRPKPRAATVLLLIAYLAISAAMIDGMYIEPFDLRTTYAKLPAGGAFTRPLRIVHLSDIHVERITRRERELIERVNTLQPDVIVLTGDYLNIDYNDDPQTRRDGRWVLSQLHAPDGVYAIPGSPGVDEPDAMAELFDGLPIHLLEDDLASVDIDGKPLYIVGVKTVHGRGNAAVMAAQMSRVPAGGYSLLLYHSPDLAEAAAEAGVDVYLAGHTHGGQIRLPFYGAIITMSAYGKRFEAGQYQVGETTLYVSRGIGMEGLRLPRVRFLCPPEIVVVDIVPSVAAIGDGGFSTAPGSPIPATGAIPAKELNR